MSKETRFCPFMRKLTREHWRTAQDRVAESYGCEVRDVLTGFKYIGEIATELEK